MRKINKNTTIDTFDLTNEFVLMREFIETGFRLAKGLDAIDIRDPEAFRLSDYDEDFGEDFRAITKGYSGNELVNHLAVIWVADHLPRKVLPDFHSLPKDVKLRLLACKNAYEASNVPLLLVDSLLPSFLAWQKETDDDVEVEYDGFLAMAYLDHLESLN